MWSNGCSQNGKSDNTLDLQGTQSKLFTNGFLKYRRNTSEVRVQGNNNGFAMNKTLPHDD